MGRFKLFVKYTNRLGLFNFWDYLFQRFIKKSSVLFVRFPGLQYRIAIRNNSSDIPLFKHIFILQEYDVAIKGKVKTIIDCGANIGLASLFFLLKYPGAKIIAVEPEENNYRMLQQNLQPYENVTCLNKAIWSNTAHIEIIDPGWGNHAFLVKEVETATKASIQAISVKDILDDFGLKEIDILKIDIEGSEEQVFSNELSWIKNVKMIFCEIHENLKPGLTKKIKSVLQPWFDFSVNGEYDVFIRRKNEGEDI